MIYADQLIDLFFSLQRENLSLAFKTGETVGIAQTLVKLNAHPPRLTFL